MRFSLRQFPIIALFSAVALPIFAINPETTPLEEVPHEPEALDYGYKVAWTPFQLGVVGRYQLFDATTPVNGLGLGIVGLHTGKSRALLLSPIYVDSEETAGISVATFYNGTAGSLGPVLQVGAVSFSEALLGVQIAAVGGVEGPMKGLQLSGITSVTIGGNTGAQISAIYSHTESTLQGLQISAVNTAGKGTSALQIAAIGNRLYAAEPDSSQEETQSRENVVQISGVFNYGSEQVNSRGVMLSAICNFTQNSFSGLQLGLFNLTKEMGGVQIGLMNDTTRLNGIQLGLFNFENGRMRLPLINIGWDSGENE